MRANAPAYWDAGNELWGISRYDDIVEIEKHKDVFVNSNTTKGGYRPNIPADPSIIGLDDPKHAERRNLVSRRFTPRAVTRWDDHVHETATALVDAAVAKGRVDVVEDLAAPLPAQMIGFLLGYPDEAWPQLKEWSERTIHLGGGPRYHDDDGIAAAFEFAAATAELYEAKKACPADDVMSFYLEVEERGLKHQGFGIDEIISDSLLLLDGGAETTRTVIARTILGLADHPDQWEALKAGADIDVAVEEFIRWVTPILNMCRVANQDYEIGGETIRAGQQVVLMYPSANRDDAHFDDPDSARRHPAPEQPHRLRLRHPLLPRGVAGPTRDQGHVPGAAGQGRPLRATSRRGGRRHPQLVRLRRQARRHHHRPELTEGWT